jgi:hypothetical protein
MYCLNHYVIRWEKVQTLDDIKRLIGAIDIAFEPNNPKLKGIMDMVKLEPKGTLTVTAR